MCVCACMHVRVNNTLSKNERNKKPVTDVSWPMSYVVLVSPMALSKLPVPSPVLKLKRHIVMYYRICWQQLTLFDLKHVYNVRIQLWPHTILRTQWISVQITLLLIVNVKLIMPYVSNMHCLLTPSLLLMANSCWFRWWAVQSRK